MKNLSLFIFVFSTSLSFAQNSDDTYYSAKKRNNWEGNSSYWYVGMEGGLTPSIAKIDNNLSNLLASQKSITDAYWNGVVGYSQQDKWQIEAGYAEIPFNARLYLNNGRSIIPFRWRNLQKAIPIRFKWRLFRIGQVKKISGLYITGGATGLFLSPQTELGKFRFIGITPLTNVKPIQYDTLEIVNKTFATGRPKIALEAGIEFVGRVSKSIQVVLSVRTLYANNVLESNTQLLLNSVLEKQAFQTISPLSYQFGFSLRYLYSFRNNQPLYHEND